MKRRRHVRDHRLERQWERGDFEDREPRWARPPKRAETPAPAPPHRVLGRVSEQAAERTAEVDPLLLHCTRCGVGFVVMPALLAHQATAHAVAAEEPAGTPHATAPRRASVREQLIAAGLLVPATEAAEAAPAAAESDEEGTP
jgi:hypothetical protein